MCHSMILVHKYSKMCFALPRGMSVIAFFSFNFLLVSLIGGNEITVLTTLNIFLVFGLNEDYEIFATKLNASMSGRITLGTPFKRV